MTVLSVSELAVAYSVAGIDKPAVRGVDFSVERGEVLALVGESGSGKTTAVQAATGLLADNGRITGGRVLLGELDVTRWNDRRFQSVRGTRIGWIPQDPANSLNPVKRIGDSVAEVLQIHRWKDREARRRRVIELLERVGIPEPEVRARQYPHELSGGMKQRVLIASAIALQPELLIADEATSALDVTVQKTVLDLIDDLREESGTAVIMITHDLAVAADRADSIVVLQGGRVQEAGPAREVLTLPESAYTRALLADAPSFHTRDALPVRKRPVDADPTIVVTGLVKEFSRGRGAAPFRAVDDVSFSVAEGTTHAIVGESGSGKTTVARILLGFETASAGEVSIATHDPARCSRNARLRFRRDVQLVYQNPFASLDPRQTIEAIVTEPLRNFGIGSAGERAARAAEILDRVALPVSVLSHRPRELSGGQRQRVAIARALIAGPQVVVLDEAVSALDVTVQAQILRLLEELQQDLGVSYVFISHDLAVVRHISDTVSVMRHGRVVEAGATAEIFSSPRHDYTARLLEAIPGSARD